MHYTHKKLTQDFTDLGIEKGDTLFIHSSFKSLGSVAEGAGTVIAALEETIGQDGFDSDAFFQSATESGRTRGVVGCCDNAFDSRVVNRVLSADARHLSF